MKHLNECLPGDPYQKQTFIVGGTGYLLRFPDPDTIGGNANAPLVIDAATEALHREYTSAVLDQFRGQKITATLMVEIQEFILGIANAGTVKP